MHKRLTNNENAQKCPNKASVDLQHNSLKMAHRTVGNSAASINKSNRLVVICVSYVVVS